MSLLKQYLKQEQKISLILLGVTLDKKENKKAAIARLNLYYESGFKIYKQEWDEYKDNIVYLYMKINLNED